MKIKDIKRRTARVTNLEAINFLLFLIDWNGEYFEGFEVSTTDESLEFQKTYEAREFIENADMDDLRRIYCHFKTTKIINFEIIFNYGATDKPGYAIINVT